MGSKVRQRLVLELDVGSDPPSGVLDDGVEPPTPFCGWAELAGAIDRAHRAAAEVPEEPRATAG